MPVHIAYLASQWLAMCETDAASHKRRLLGWAVGLGQVGLGWEVGHRVGSVGDQSRDRFQTGWHRARTWQCTWLCTSCPVSLCPPVPHAGPQGHGHASPGGFTGKPVAICLGRARALHRHWHWRWVLAEEGHRHHSPAQMLQPSCEHGHGRCSAPQTLETDPFQAVDGPPGGSIPSQAPRAPFCRCDAVNTPSVQYQQCPSSLPGHQHVYPHHTTHHTPHTTHHTPPPSLSEAAKHCHLHHPSLHPPMYSVPSTMLRGRGWRSGGLDSLCCAMVLSTAQSRCRIRMYTYGTGWARPKSPPFASDTTAATRITAWPRRQPHQGRERFRSSRW